MHNTHKAIVSSARAVTLLGGGALGQNDLKIALARAPVLVAADSGAKNALAAGHIPVAVIGDLDSYHPHTNSIISPAHIHHIAEQDTTDFDKALRHIAAPLVLAIGVTGGRIDHQLAMYHTLVRHAERRCIAIGAEDIVFHAPSQISLTLPKNTRVSLFPMQSVSGQSQGLRWPIDGIDFHPARKIGTSNEVVENVVKLSFNGPGMLIILPRVHLDFVIEALL